MTIKMSHLHNGLLVFVSKELWHGNLDMGRFGIKRSVNICNEIVSQCNFEKTVVRCVKTKKES